MENTVVLYKWHNLQATPGWEAVWGYSDEYCGRYGFVDCDEGKKYILPDGYTYGESVAGSMEFYDSKGSLACLGTGGNLPRLYSNDHPQGIGMKMAPVESEAV